MKYILLLFLIILTSCTSEENLNLQENSKFQGNYIGVFNGSVSGKISFKVSDTGNLEGSVEYDNATASENLSGYVPISGKFDASTKSGLNFFGYLNDLTINAKWTKGNSTGDCILNKK
ncbi:hypothetical protein NZ698_15565 [Chryseobacterium sp. PBS4-4]|uniref:Lipoprotein n=1 Tax=Chryseobacterium edaphi TaxID=2976532 RepID=A0ABT2W8R6_9FLAO|nr:hypothetical protein [Chryseobacterium edaphi]MCU7618612.1 hypothetical protein [Chryseobacterium edaphi]